MTCKSLSRVAVGIVFSCWAFLSQAVANVDTWQKEGVVLSPNFEFWVENYKTLGLFGSPYEGEVEATYSPWALVRVDSTSQHVQGLAWASWGPNKKVWAITHNARAVYTGSLLLLCNDPFVLVDNSEAECHAHMLGKDSHPGGGVQIMGNILITGDESDNTKLYDIRDIANPRPLKCGISAKGGAAGLAWHAGLGAHIAITGRTIWMSNGEDLDSSRCLFTKISENVITAGGEALTQIFYDPPNNRMIAFGGVGDFNGSNQALRYQYFSVDAAGRVTHEDRQSIALDIGLLRFRGAPIPGVFNGPNFKWGATIRMTDNMFDVVVSARELTGAGAFDPDMTVGVFGLPFVP